jgi:hypothetical protein
MAGFQYWLPKTDTEPIELMAFSLHGADRNNGDKFSQKDIEQDQAKRPRTEKRKASPNSRSA